MYYYSMSKNMFTHVYIQYMVFTKYKKYIYPALWLPTAHNYSLMNFVVASKIIYGCSKENQSSFST